MTISMQKAKSLCTANELNLVQWSSPRRLRELTPAKLRQKISRARDLRDKFRDLAKRQRGEARGKRKPSGTRPAKGNERTVEKAELFAEVLSRFEAELKRQESADSGSSNRRTTGSAGGKKRTTTKARARTTKNKSEPKAASGNASARGPSGGKKLKKAAKPQAAGPSIPIPVAPDSPAPKHMGRAATITADTSSSNPLTGLTGLSSLVAQESRQTRRKKMSDASKVGREQSRFARTAREKIQGHVSAQTRRAQARRDAK